MDPPIHSLRLRWEAAGTLLAARLAIRFVPFRWLVRLFEWPPWAPELEGYERDRVRAEVRNAVYHAARRLPGTVCYPQAVAAQMMLRRRGVSTTLYCGAASMSGVGLSAHVWLQDGEHGVAGKSASHRYQALARFSNTPDLSSRTENRVGG